jgi:hypothetical protein
LLADGDVGVAELAWRSVKHHALGARVVERGVHHLSAGEEFLRSLLLFGQVDFFHRGSVNAHRGIKAGRKLVLPELVNALGTFGTGCVFGHHLGGLSLDDLLVPLSAISIVVTSKPVIEEIVLSVVLLLREFTRGKGTGDSKASCSSLLDGLESLRLRQHVCELGLVATPGLDGVS